MTLGVKIKKGDFASKKMYSEKHNWPEKDELKRKKM
jgi:hypothetical protein